VVGKGGGEVQHLKVIAVVLKKKYRSAPAGA
jgi:hypothetical protein